jgi:hypothetical protein
VDSDDTAFARQEVSKSGVALRFPPASKIGGCGLAALGLFVPIRG